MPCPRLATDVELTVERAEHIRRGHPDLLPGHMPELKLTLADPDTLRRSQLDPEPILFARWFPRLKGGRFVVVVVRYDFSGERFWITTAYLTQRLVAGETEWQRD
jgi:hypothetical protein